MTNYTDIIAQLKKEFDGDNISEIIKKAIQEGERLEKQRQEKTRQEKTRQENKNGITSDLRIFPAEIIRSVQKTPLDDTVLQALYKESLTTANLASSLHNQTFPQWIQDYFKHTSSSEYVINFINFYQENDDLSMEPKGDERKEHIAKIIAYMLRHRIEGDNPTQSMKGDNKRRTHAQPAGDKKDSTRTTSTAKEDRFGDRENLKNTKSRNNDFHGNRNNDSSRKNSEVSFIDDLFAQMFNVDPKDIKDARKEVKETRNDAQSELMNIVNNIFNDIIKDTRKNDK